MRTVSPIDFSDVKEIFELLEIPEEDDSPTDFYSVPQLIPAWNFGEQPDDGVYSSSTMI